MESSELNVASKFELYGCYQCGKCTGGCPVSLKSRLNIRRLMIEGILGKNLDRLEEREELWDCTTCKTCTLRCPRGLKPMDLVIGMRGMLVEEGHLPKSIIEAMENAYKHGNPWGKAKSKRTEWLKSLPEGIKVKDFSQGDRAEYLYFVGCTAASDPRIQEIAKAMVFLFQQSGVDFAILGNEEQCCGNEIRRMGEAGLFEELMMGNVERFESYGIDHILTACPHGYNVFKNEYPQGKFEVLHATQILRERIEEGKVPLTRPVKKVVTYHDPCFLGKQNQIFDDPRILLTAIPGLTLRELDRSRERSLCCEGGGGKMWAESSSDTGQRLAEIRVQDAVALGAEVIATACPLCVLTLEDAVKTSGHEERIRVMDVMELLAEAID
ncbi:MAG: (Fe-S)-binding protein [Desulfobacterota bacterium]|nr:(Fe-S)-binding protein [Thermodesulfobacteriota bacterium]